MRSVFSRLRLASQAAIVPRFEELLGSTLLTMNISSRRLPTASATIRSASPLPYISAVSIKVTPRSIPCRSAAASFARFAALSPIRHVPRPKVGICRPEWSAVVGIRGIGSFRSLVIRNLRIADNSPTLLMLRRRRAVRVERLDRLQAPRLALLPFLLRPGDRLPVGREDETRAGIRHFDAVAAGLVD